MGYAGIALQIAGGVSSYMQADSAGSAAKKTSDFNAKVADLQAADAIKRAESDASDRSRETGQLQGAQRAALAAQGIDPNEVGGTAEDLQNTAQMIGQRDMDTIKANATRTAWGYKIDAANSRLAGTIAKHEASQKGQAALINSGASIYKDGYDAGYWGGSPKGATVPTTPKRSGAIVTKSD